MIATDQRLCVILTMELRESEREGEIAVGLHKMRELKSPEKRTHSRL